MNIGTAVSCHHLIQLLQAPWNMFATLWIRHGSHVAPTSYDNNRLVRRPLKTFSAEDS